MKKNLNIIIILFCFIILFIFLFFTPKHPASDQLKTNENEKIIQVKNGIYFLERKNEKEPFRVEVRYPQIDNHSHQGISKKINMLIQDIAFSMFNEKTYSDAIYSLEELKKDTKRSIGVYVNYNILHKTDDYISLMFAAEAFYGGGDVRSTHYLSTINLKTGNCITYNDLIQTEQLVEVIRDGYYEIYQGNYSELGDGRDPALIEQFIDAIGLSIDTTPSTAVYDRGSIQNIGIDESSLYIQFYFEYSLGGYIILKIPLEHVELKLDINNDLQTI